MVERGVDLTQHATDGADSFDDGASLGELFSKLTKDFSQLVSTQVELAKVELKEEATQAAKGAGMLAGAGVAGHLAVLLLSFAAAWGIATAIPAGFAFLIVGAAWAIAAGVLALNGRTQLRTVQAVPPQSKQALKEDIEWARQQKS
jgi:uncharacterized membrane protein YqjE